MFWNVCRRIEENGDKIYSSQFETNRVIENLVLGLSDEYTYYRPPGNDERYVRMYVCMYVRLVLKL